MTDTRICDGCKKPATNRTAMHVNIQNIGKFWIHAVTRHFNRYIDYNCLFAAVGERCWGCGREDHTYRRPWLETFSLVCTDCSRFIVDGKRATSDLSVFVLENNLPGDSEYESERPYGARDFVGTLARLLDPMQTEYAPYKVRLRSEQAPLLERLMYLLKLRLEQNIAKARREGRALLSKLASGELTASQWDQETKKQDTGR